jgi:hypothetical protein
MGTDADTTVTIPAACALKKAQCPNGGDHGYQPTYYGGE